MNLTYIPSDKIVIVDGRAIQSDYVTPSIYEGSLHAVVWSDIMKEYQTVIKNTFCNIPLQEEDYTDYVLPLWQQWESQRQVEDNPVEMPELTLHERALQVKLTKREFVIIIEYLTSTQEGMTPITYQFISEYVTQSTWVTKREWELATYIERSHAMLDIVSKDFGISTEMLDYMFAEYQPLLELAYAWESSKG